MVQICYIKKRKAPRDKRLAPISIAYFVGFRATLGLDRVALFFTYLLLSLSSAMKGAKYVIDKLDDT